MTNFDHAAAVPVDARVREAMLPFFTERYGNPQSLHRLGGEAKEAIEQSRNQVAALIGAESKEIVFTSCGTESNNLAVKGVTSARAGKGKHIVVSAVEHASVLNPARTRQKQGWEVTEVAVDKFGMIAPDDVKKAIRSDTVLVSVMTANNEVGTIQPIAEIGEICRSAGVLFHTDAVAAAGWIPLDVKPMKVDLLSLAGQSFGGPKGSGALFVRQGVHLSAQLDGGIQENGRRAGSEDVPAIVGLGKAAELARMEMVDRARKVAKLRDVLLRELPNRIDRVILTGHSTERLPNHASFLIEFIEGEGMLLFLNDEGFAVASGSACASKSLKASHVLLAMGVSHALAQGSLVLTLGSDNNRDDVDRLLERLPRIVQRLRHLSPLYARFLKNPSGYE